MNKWIQMTTLKGDRVPKEPKRRVLPNASETRKQSPPKSPPKRKEECAKGN
jgi:hypothetical protein